MNKSPEEIINWPDEDSGTQVNSIWLKGERIFTDLHNTKVRSGTGIRQGGFRLSVLIKLTSSLYLLWFPQCWLRSQTGFLSIWSWRWLLMTSKREAGLPAADSLKRHVLDHQPTREAITVNSKTEHADQTGGREHAQPSRKVMGAPVKSHWWEIKQEAGRKRPALTS